MSRMVEVGEKEIVRREAIAEGFLALRPGTLDAISSHAIPKGDVFEVARVAGLLAAKRTPDNLPLCHPIPLTGAEVHLIAEPSGVRARAIVTATWKTGVEMEALSAVTTALLCCWDMVKALEKDEDGQYPETRIEDVRVIKKVKEVPS